MSGAKVAVPCATPRRLAPLLVLTVLCGLPVVASWVLYLNPQLLPARGGQHGILIEPPLAVNGRGLRTPGGERPAPDALRGRWTLIWLTTEPCDRQCATVLRRMHAIRLALREYAAGFQSIAIGLEAEGQRLQARAPADVRVLIGSPEVLRQFGRRVAASAQGLPPGAFYVVDPRGSAMMRYALTEDPEGILEDLMRLLKYSRVGQ